MQIGIVSWKRTWCKPFVLRRPLRAFRFSSNSSFVSFRFFLSFLFFFWWGWSTSLSRTDDRRQKRVRNEDHRDELFGIGVINTFHRGFSSVRTRARDERREINERESGPNFIAAARFRRFSFRRTGREVSSVGGSVTRRGTSARCMRMSMPARNAGTPGPRYQFMRCNIVRTRFGRGPAGCCRGEGGHTGMGHTEKLCIRGECLVRPCWRSTIIQAGEYQTG